MKDTCKFLTISYGLNFHQIKMKFHLIPFFFFLYRVIAFEKCLMNLSEYYGKLRHLYERLIPMPSDREILLQLATGLQYIHSKGIVHCDIKRENVLISHRQGSGEVVLKWTAFSLSKAGEDDGEPKPWSYYSDPNSDYDPRRSEMLPATFSSDVFLLGCVFFTVLLPDVYPFGYYAHSIRTPITILTGKKSNKRMLISYLY